MTATYAFVGYGSGAPNTSLSGIAKVRVKDSSVWLSGESGEQLAVLPIDRLGVMWRTDVSADKADDDVMLVFTVYGVLNPGTSPVARVPGVKKIKASIQTGPYGTQPALYILQSDDEDLPAGVVGFNYGVRREDLAL